MKATWLFPDSDEANRLVVFFTGWAMNQSAIAHLTPLEGYCFLHMEDYRSMEVAFRKEFTRYKQIIYIAWSMGVWGAERAVREGVMPKPNKAIAIAGSPFPYHDTYGIPKLWFERTLSGLTPENRLRFLRRMVGGKRLKALFDALEQRDLDEIRVELQTVLRYEVAEAPLRKSLSIPWTRAVIAAKDRIFPVQNLTNVWKDYGVPIVVLPDAEHYFLDRYTSWREVLYLGCESSL